MQHTQYLENQGLSVLQGHLPKIFTSTSLTLQRKLPPEYECLMEISSNIIKQHLREMLLNALVRKDEELNKLKEANVLMEKDLEEQKKINLSLSEGMEILKNKVENMEKTLHHQNKKAHPLIQETYKNVCVLSGPNLPSCVDNKNSEQVDANLLPNNFSEINCYPNISVKDEVEVKMEDLDIKMEVTSKERVFTQIPEFLGEDKSFPGNESNIALRENISSEELSQISSVNSTLELRELETDFHVDKEQGNNYVTESETPTMIQKNSSVDQLKTLNSDAGQEGKESKRTPVKYRRYDKGSLFEAVRLVREEKFSVYKASQQCRVPWSTLNDFVKNSKDNSKDLRQCVPKMGKPFALSVEMEQRICRYILDMQELGFHLTVLQIRRLAYKLSETTGKKNTFNNDKKAAGEWWWKDFKNRYGLTLRVPEVMASYRSSMPNRNIINNFYDRLNELMAKLGLENKPDSIWNCDVTGLSYVVKSTEIDIQIGKKYVDKHSYADQGENCTMVGCINASGHWIPPMVIFNGVRMSDAPIKNIIPGSLVKDSPNGVIYSELFLEWFHHFITSIPLSRPVILLMDSHASYVSDDVINLAKEKSIFLFTFPSQTNILQPLDVGIYPHFKQAWSKSLYNHMIQNPGQKPNRSNFYSLMSPAFFNAFSPTNIISSFRKTGIHPFNRDAITEEAMSTFRLTGECNPIGIDVPSVPIRTRQEIDEILAVPSIERPVDEQKKRNVAKCLTPLQDPSTKGTIGNPKVVNETKQLPSTSGIPGKRKRDDDDDYD